MSRLIIKNLPSYVTPVHIRKHFEQKGGPGGTLTDIKVAFKPDGTSRRFGFIGYKSEQEAAAAEEWFDRTFIDSTRISVSLVEGAKDAPTPRPNKRRRLEPLPNVTDSTRHSISSTSRGKVDHTDSHKVTESNQQEEKNEAMSDMEWLRKHTTRKLESDLKAFEQDDEDIGRASNVHSASTEHSFTGDPDLVLETIRQTRRLFVRNLVFTCTEADLRHLFELHGEVTQVHLPLDPLSKQPKGLAYITFAQPSCAVAAYEALDRKSFQGRLLHILPAVDRKGKVQIEEGEGRKLKVKEEKAHRRKSLAEKGFNWSILYMNSDAVASSIADRMNISKADILNPESDNAAVKLALAETHVIQETKAYLESQGVILSAFSSRARSDTTILVKNIPYGTTADQIREMFEPYGTLSCVLVPPAGTMAVVEFMHADEASIAFKSIAYRRFGNAVIYLEKGPMGMFVDVPAAPDGQLETSTAGPIRIPEHDVGDDETGEEAVSIAAGTTLYIKNLSFATTTERLINVFRHLPSFSFARVQTKPDPKRPPVRRSDVEAPRLSMGYGFVGFKDIESAKKAMKSMQEFVLDGHALHVKFAGRGLEEAESGKDKERMGAKNRTTKIIVKNVPFEATKKDIRALFSAHGQLKSVRLPKKFDSRSRGFAFLEFVTRQEAQNAFNALRHTHLLGRHLVLEWAEEAEQDIDVLRQKAGVGYGGGKELPGRKRKLDLDGESMDPEDAKN